MTEPLPYPWPEGVVPPKRVRVVWSFPDGTIGQVIRTRPEKIAGYAAVAAEDGATILIFPDTPDLDAIANRTHRIEQGRIVERDTPLVSERERKEQALREAAEIPEGASILEHRLAALERAIAGLDIPEADEVRRIRDALDGAEAPQSKDRES